MKKIDVLPLILKYNFQTNLVFKDFISKQDYCTGIVQLNYLLIPYRYLYLKSSDLQL